MKYLTYVFTTFLSVWLCAQKPSSNIQVTLKDGSMLNPSSLKYKTPAFGSPHLLLNGKKKLEAYRVKSYRDGEGYFVLAIKVYNE